MNVSEAIEARRSVKHYDPDHIMPEADLAELIRLIKLAPSSFNMQNYRILVIRDPEVRQLHPAVAAQQQVGGLDVEVGDLLGVQGRQARQQAAEDGQSLLGGQPAALAGQVLFEVAAVHQLHDNVGGVAVGVEVAEVLRPVAIEVAGAFERVEEGVVVAVVLIVVVKKYPLRLVNGR